MRLDDLYDYFDCVQVLNLEQRPDRWRQFRSNLPMDWPFLPPQKFVAVDGSRIDYPSNWKSNHGAWGCYLSHLRILEMAIERELDSILVLEDDAVFCKTFSMDVRSFFAELPEDWELIYLGGQHIELHLGLPEKVSTWVYRPFNTNRTHAYAIRGREALRRIHSYLSEPKNWTENHHVDHFLGAYQKSHDRVYVPMDWLVAQDDGLSDVTGAEVGFRSFLGAKEINEPKVSLPMVAVLGPYSGGTSAVAGALHHLGVSMGSHFETPDKTNRSGNFEAVELARLCRLMFEEPWLTENVAYETRVKLLEIWASSHTKSHSHAHRVVGGKHPILSLLGPELSDAWQRPAIISVERDEVAIVNSLVKRQWGWPLDACLSVTRQLLASREQFLQSTTLPVIRVQYETLVSDPMRVLDQLCRFLNLSPTQEEFNRAVEFVK